MHIYTVFFKKVKTIVFILNLRTCQIVITFNINDVFLFKQANKYAKRIALTFYIYVLKLKQYQPSFFDWFLAVFSVSYATNFFIHSLNRCFLKKLLMHCWFSAMRCSFCSLHIQIYPLNACTLDWEENLFGLYAQSIAFTIKILKVTST